MHPWTHPLSLPNKFSNHFDYSILWSGNLLFAPFSSPQPISSPKSSPYNPGGGGTAAYVPDPPGGGGGALEATDPPGGGGGGAEAAAASPPDTPGAACPCACCAC